MLTFKFTLCITTSNDVFRQTTLSLTDPASHNGVSTTILKYQTGLIKSRGYQPFIKLWRPDSDVQTPMIDPALIANRFGNKTVWYWDNPKPMCERYGFSFLGSSLRLISAADGEDIVELYTGFTFTRHSSVEIYTIQFFSRIMQWISEMWLGQNVSFRDRERRSFRWSWAIQDGEVRNARGIQHQNYLIYLALRFLFRLPLEKLVC